MHRLKYILTLLYIVCSIHATAQEEQPLEWHRYYVDSFVSIEIPRIVAAGKYDSTNGFAIYDSTMAFLIHYIDLSGDMDELKGMNKQRQAKHVYKTYVARLRRQTRHEIVERTWTQRDKDYRMLIWYPASELETSYYIRIRPIDYGYNPSVVPPLVQFERLLFYNNKLYSFAVTCVTQEYHGRKYYELGGRSLYELDKMKNKFFRSIRVKKLP